MQTFFLHDQCYGTPLPTADGNQNELSTSGKHHHTIKLFVTCLFLAISTAGFGQSTLAGWNFNNTFSPTAASVVSGVTALTSAAGPGIVGANFGQFFVTLSGRTYFTANFWTQNQSIDVNDYVQFGLSPASTNRLYISALKLDLSYTEVLGATGPQNVVLRSSVDNYGTDITIPFTGVSTSWQTITMPVTSPIQSNSTITFRLYGYDSEGVLYTLRLDNLQLKGSVSNLSTTALSGLTATCANPSAAQSFTVTANGATGAVSLNAPAGFELAAQTGATCPATGYASTTTVSPASGIISQGICVRRQGGLTAGSTSANEQLTITGGGIATATIGLSGSTTAAPILNISSSSLTVCQGISSTLAAVASGAGGYTYSWSPSPDAGQSTSIITVSGTDAYSVTITDANGCSATASANVLIKPLPNAGFSGLPAAYCFGASPVTLSPATSGGTFAVSGPGSLNGNRYTPPVSGVDASAIVSYSVSVDGCSASSSQTVVLGAKLPAVNNFTSVGTLGNGTCAIQLQATGVGTSFVFTGPNGYKFSTVYREAGIHDAIAIKVTEPGTYTVSVNTGACQVSNQIQITGTACGQ